MPIDFPKTIDELSVEWLTTILGGEVNGFDVSFLEGGVLSDAFRIHNITYADSSAAGPASVVVKLANKVGDQRKSAIENRAYIKELKFFRELADKIPVRTPILYGAYDDGTADTEFFILVMEDLTTHSHVFDQVTDSPDEDFTRKINLEVAGMHAKFWQLSLIHI